MGWFAPECGCFCLWQLPSLTSLKDTGAKPFKCAICQRSFSRGDVLSRHVKGHKQAAQPQAVPSSSSSNQPALNPFQSPVAHSTSSRSSSVIPDVAPPHAIPVPPAVVGDPIAGNDGNSMHTRVGNVGHIGHIGHITWPSATRPEARFAQPDMSTSLLWPDSEDLFQSLMSADGMSWDQSMPGLIPAPELTHQLGSARPRASVSTPGDDELAAAEDGHRAVQTINGLLTNTVRLCERSELRHFATHLRAFTVFENQLIRSVPVHSFSMSRPMLSCLT